MFKNIKSKGFLIELLIFIFGILIIYFGIYKGFLLLSSSGEELSQKQQTLQEWQAKQELVKSLSDKIQDNTLKEDLSLSFPARKATAELLSSLQAAAVKSGVSISSFSPGNITIAATAEEPTSTPALTAPSTYRISSYATSLLVRGNYKQVYNYLNYLEKIKQVTQMRSFNLTKGDNDTIVTNITLIIYYITK